MPKKYLGKEETARMVSKLIEKEYPALVNDNLCDEATLQSIIVALGSPDDTGGDVGVGSIFARLNAISTLAGSGGTKEFKPPISVKHIGSVTTITGKGIALVSSSFNSVVVDGVTAKNTSLEDDGSDRDCPFYFKFYKSFKLNGGVYTVVLY